MLHDKCFNTWHGVNLSIESFPIEEGLQQGTIDSPIFFNLFPAKIPKMFGFNNSNWKFAKAFADDLIAYLTESQVPQRRIE
ncbi:Protein of unknown function [Cotesia congregata]|uniref:Reverse transcriptase domain-containing protein n=1 Tax=Cotesia congregata TaxID=51543 RepID=A0A8J2H683_COTCN|nr:Protein of unknown function [Cotesia congregata]